MDDSISYDKAFTPGSIFWENETITCESVNRKQANVIGLDSQMNENIALVDKPMPKMQGPFLNDHPVFPGKIVNPTSDIELMFQRMETLNKNNNSVISNEIKLASNENKKDINVLNKNITSIDNKLTLVSDEVLEFKNEILPQIIDNSQKITEIQNQVETIEKRVEIIKTNVTCSLKNFEHDLEIKFKTFLNSQNNTVPSKADDFSKESDQTFIKTFEATATNFDTQSPNNNLYNPYDFAQPNPTTRQGLPHYPENQTAIINLAKFPGLPRFDGSGIIAPTFLTQVENYFNLARVFNPKDKIQALTFMLKGKALDWYYSEDIGFQGWEDFKIKFLKQYHAPYIVQRKWDQWCNTPLDETMDIVEYVQDGLNLLKVIRPFDTFASHAVEISKKLPYRISHSMLLECNRFTCRQDLIQKLHESIQADRLSKNQGKPAYNSFKGGYRSQNNQPYKTDFTDNKTTFNPTNKVGPPPPQNQRSNNSNWRQRGRGRGNRIFTNSQNKTPSVNNIQAIATPQPTTNQDGSTPTTPILNPIPSTSTAVQMDENQLSSLVTLISNTVTNDLYYALTEN